MGRFSVAAKAEARRNRQYFAIGKYKVRITEVEAFDADGLCVSAKCEILESNNPDVEEGEIRQTFWPVAKKKHPGAQFFKTFVAIAMGVDPEDEDISAEDWEKSLELVVSSKQPLTGKVMIADVVPVMKDGEMMKARNGDPFTNINWKLVKDAAAA